jgi:major membrane immunogen (membrane-anchored lipoprotein)
MKKIKPFFLIIMIMALFIACSVFKRQNSVNSYKSDSGNPTIYKDGIYVGTSRSSYVSEPFWGRVSLTIRNGYFTSISFSIRDSALHETFDEHYEKHYEGNPLYVQQCRYDWGGVKSYPKKLYKKQIPEEVDCMSGATWSYNIFQASLKEALKDAKK